MHVWETGNAHKILVLKLQKKRHLGNWSIDGKIILTFKLDKLVVNMCSGTMGYFRCNPMVGFFFFQTGVKLSDLIKSLDYELPKRKSVP
jgi:hypothetical protein